MKNIVIGDIHGKDVWKKLIPKEYDSLTFVGDYFDCFEEIPTVTQVRNFKEICDFASVDPRVNLCIGNHDYQYIADKNCHCSGFQYYGQWDIKEAIQQNLDLLNVVYIVDDTIISHSGVSSTWLKDHSLTVDTINETFKANNKICKWNGNNMYGDDVTQSPLWIRPRSLLSDLPDDYKQIVGHTHQKDITTIGRVTFVDCLDTVEKVYEF